MLVSFYIVFVNGQSIHIYIIYYKKTHRKIDVTFHLYGYIY